MKKWILTAFLILSCWGSGQACAQVNLCVDAIRTLSNATKSIFTIFPVRSKSILSLSKKMNPNDIRLFGFGKRRYLVLFDNKVYDFHPAFYKGRKNNHPQFYEIEELGTSRAIQRRIGWTTYNWSRSRSLSSDEAGVFRDEIHRAMNDPEGLFQWSEPNLEDRFNLRAKNFSRPLVGKGRRLAQIGALAAVLAVALSPWPWSYNSAILRSDVGPLPALGLRGLDQRWSALSKRGWSSLHAQLVHAQATGWISPAHELRHLNWYDRLILSWRDDVSLSNQFQRFYENPDKLELFIGQALADQGVDGRLPNKLLAHVFPEERDWTVDSRRRVSDALLADAISMHAFERTGDEFAYLKRLGILLKNEQAHGFNSEGSSYYMAAQFAHRALRGVVEEHEHSETGPELVKLLMTDLKPLLSRDDVKEAVVMTIGQLGLTEYEPWLMQNLKETSSRSNLYPSLAWALHHLDTPSARQILRSEILPSIKLELDSLEDSEKFGIRRARLLLMDSMIRSGKKHYLFTADDSASKHGVKDGVAPYYSHNWWAAFGYEPMGYSY